jgi:hypothetical protein
LIKPSVGFENCAAAEIFAVFFNTLGARETKHIKMKQCLIFSVALPELVFTVRLILDYLLDFGSCYSQSRFAIRFRGGYRFHNLNHLLIVKGRGLFIIL